ncbi:hypothetical protein J31TS4_42140 [Paenibacillus sp. J31TS4]|uniref:AtpZ/AtpI family protein n=1 Tax=Paenibacillus sp. J31TS4 TaxID=2807195 RepID=UPI001B1F67C2|nr:AtpZ/AtpI family protein [Paenibacillus sp. J31TS4]GIP40934.1 hypothetical protein J31TS4_42140 [Paenibacillus sp. J31TS4]
MKKSGFDNSPWRAAGLVGAVGIDIVVCMLLGYFAGSWMSGYMGGNKLWIAGGLLAGLFIGILNVIFLIKFFLEETNE